MEESGNGYFYDKVEQLKMKSENQFRVLLLIKVYS